jgi:site-specific DNA-methyltransferase (cytosine-N4-specific)
MLLGQTEDVLLAPHMKRFRGKVNLIFTSPPFALNRKKQYGNHTGDEYVEWLASFSDLLVPYLAPTGSIVMELGNAWEPGLPVMSTLAMEALLAFKRRQKLHLCQEFIWYNPARLPGPAQWVNVERIRAKDCFTRLWWMSPSERPKANNRNVLVEYTQSMQKLLRSGKYNPGKRPSEHHIGETSFLTDNGGAIPGNVLTMSNTENTDPYQDYCREHGIGKHPARMPFGLATFFIKFLTDPGDLVLDPFGGSNTTGAAAEANGRNWISIEANEEYVRGSQGRFEQQAIEPEADASSRPDRLAETSAGEENQLELSVKPNAE